MCLFNGIPTTLFAIIAKYRNVFVGVNILEMSRVVYKPSVKVMELTTLTHIGVMFYLNAFPKTLLLPSINCLITSTGNAGIVMDPGFKGEFKRNLD
jgi:hypothetical protein